MKRKHPLFILIGVLGWFALQPLLNLAVVFVATAVYAAGAGSEADFALWYAQMGNGLLIVTNALVLLVIRLAAGRSQVSLSRFTGLNAPMGGPRALALCVVGGVAANTWFSLVIASGLVPDSMLDSYSEAYRILEGGSPLVALVATVFAAPLAEELIFRGLILRRLRAVMPVGAAILIQAVFFGIAHGNLLWGLYAAALGAVIGYLTVYGGGLRTAVCFHMAFNAGAHLYGLLGYGAFALVVSGGVFLWAVLTLCKRRYGLVS